MELDDFARGAVAAILADQVADKTGYVFRVTGGIAVLALLGVVIVDGWMRWLTVFVLLACVVLLLLVFLTKRVAMGLINRIAPPANISHVREKFDAAVAESDFPTGPVGLLGLFWRLRKGIGPEIERLGAVVTKFKSELE